MKMISRMLMTAVAVAALAAPAMAADKLIVQDATGTVNKFVVTDAGLVGINTATPSGGSLHIVATDTPVLNDILGNNQTAGMGVDVSTPAGVSPSGAVQAANWSFLVKYKNNGNITNNFNTFRMIARTDPSVTDPLTGQFAAANFMAQHAGSNTATLVIGFLANAANRGTGSITEAIAMSAGTPTVLAGSIATAKGVNIKAQKGTGVTTGYSIYQEGTADINYLAGLLRLPNLPVYADNTAASSLAAGTLYRTSTGVVMVKY